MRTATKEKVNNGTEPKEQKTLADLSLTDLKSMAYDELALIQGHQANLQALNVEIQRRSQVKP